MAKKGLFKKILKWVLIGGGSVLSLLCPPAGGAVITAGMAIGTGAIAAGTLINTDKPVSVDTVTSTIGSALYNAGLLSPAPITTTSGTKGFAITSTGLMVILAIIAGVILIFKRRRR